MPMQVELTPQMIKKIEEVLNKGYVCEVKIEHGTPTVISISRRVVK